MKAIPIAVRERILKLYDQGQGTGEIAARFGYCVAAVRRVRQHFQARKARLLRLLARQPDATLAELGAQLDRPTSTIDLWLNRLGWSYKKNAGRRGAVAARRGRTKKAVAATAGGRLRRPAGLRG